MVTVNGTRNAARSWEVAARAGYVVSGVLHVLIGLLALRIAFGSGTSRQTSRGR